MVFIGGFAKNLKIHLDPLANAPIFLDFFAVCPLSWLRSEVERVSENRILGISLSHEAVESLGNHRGNNIFLPCPTRMG